MCMCISVASSRSRKQIRKLKYKKTPGYDNIDFKVLNSLPKRIIVFLITIYNLILRLNYFAMEIYKNNNNFKTK